MSRCLNCNYELTFLKRRHKYKCSKCSSLFTEEEIKLEEFNKYNKTERAKGKKEIEKEIQILIKNSNKNLTDEERKEREIEVQKRYCKRHREELNKYKREYWAKHRKKILQKRKEGAMGGKQNELRKDRRKENIQLTRINGRIEYWKRRQKMMAESVSDEFLLHNIHNKPKKILPTLVLA